MNLTGVIILAVVWVTAAFMVWRWLEFSVRDGSPRRSEGRMGCKGIWRERFACTDCIACKVDAEGIITTFKRRPLNTYSIEEHRIMSAALITMHKVYPSPKDFQSYMAGEHGY